MKKKIWIVVLMVLIAAGVIAGCFVLFKDSGTQDQQDAVYTNSVADLMGLSPAQQGLQNRYAGVVEPQKTLEIQLESGKAVAEIYVQEGAEVKEGDPLFRYDTEELSMSLEQQKLELEKLDNSLESQRQKIAELEKEKERASSDQQLQYTMEIQESNANLKQSEYERKVKAMEIEKTQKSIDQAIVTNTMAGVVRSINENPASTDMYGETQSFMTILATGEYRVKGLINEQNIYMVSADMPVTIRSRVREDLVWTGHISEIDMENPEQGNQNNYYVGMADTSLQSSKYPFYVVLDSYDGLMLGQHVYIETGESSTTVHTEGVWLYEGYLMQEEDGTYSVWAEDDGEIQKRTVTLGQYDEAGGQYEIVEGLSREDRIAWPEEGLEAGAPVMIE